RARGQDQASRPPRLGQGYIRNPVIPSHLSELRLSAVYGGRMRQIAESARDSRWRRRLGRQEAARQRLVRYRTPPGPCSGRLRMLADEEKVVLGQSCPAGAFAKQPRRAGAGVHI